MAYGDTDEDSSFLQNILINTNPDDENSHDQLTHSARNDSSMSSDSQDSIKDFDDTFFYKQSLRDFTCNFQFKLSGLHFPISHYNTSRVKSKQ